MRRSLIAGLVLAVLAALVISLGGAPDPTSSTSPCSVAPSVASGSCPIPTRGAASPASSWASRRVDRVCAAAAVLPDSSSGRAVTAFLVVALCALACAFSMNRLPFGAPCSASRPSSVPTRRPTPTPRRSSSGSRPTPRPRCCSRCLGYLATSVVHDFLAGDDDELDGEAGRRRRRRRSLDTPSTTSTTARPPRRPHGRRQEVNSTKRVAGMGGHVLRMLRGPGDGSRPCGRSRAGHGGRRRRDEHRDRPGVPRPHGTAGRRTDLRPGRHAGHRHGGPEEPGLHRGLRNLDQFGGFEVEDGQMVGTYEVDGDLRLRAVSDFTKTLPLEVQVVSTCSTATRWSRTTSWGRPERSRCATPCAT